MRSPDREDRCWNIRTAADLSQWTEGKETGDMTEGGARMETVFREQQDGGGSEP